MPLPRSFNTVRSPLSGETISSYAQFARSSSTDDYSQYDAVNGSTDTTVTPMTFSGMARLPGTGGTIVDVIVETDDPADVKQYRLHLYKSAPGAYVADGTLFPLLYANRLIRACASIDVGPVAKESSSDSTAAYASMCKDGLRRYQPYQCASTSTELFGLLETLTAGTPVVSQNYTVTLTAILD
jgi:hypothetical protein